MKKQLLIISLLLFGAALSYSVLHFGFDKSGENTTNYFNKSVSNLSAATFPGQAISVPGLGSLEIKDPVSFKNLQIFPITSNQRDSSRKYISLSEALDKKLVKVNETGNVNQLSIENYSDLHIYINSGDIVKGGQQDRTLGQDMIIPPKSGEVPLESYCVESGRWSKRGKEDAGEFSTNTTSLSTRKQKIAAKYSANQSEVWSSVADQQKKLNENISKMEGKDVDVRSEKSQSSLQLSLENKDLKKIIDNYNNEFRGFTGDSEIIGFAYAVNGTVYGIDIYKDHNLLEMQWPKLLDAMVAEAITDYKEDQSETAEIDDIISLMNKADNGNKNKRKVNDQTEVTTYESEDVILFETTDKSSKEEWVHRNYISQDSTTRASDNKNENKNEIQQGFNNDIYNR